MMVLVTGASCSGKSAFAEECLTAFGEKKRVYVATMIPWDEECVVKIEKHRRMRAEKGFETLECPVDLNAAVIEPGSAVLLECLSNLTANEMYRENGTMPEGCPDVRCGIEDPGLVWPADRILEGLRMLKDSTEDLVVVTNEVFSDGQSYSKETIEYMKVLGFLNRQAASMADEVVEVVCGIPIWLKGGVNKEDGYI